MRTIKLIDNDTAYQEIPKFWDEICEKYAANVYAGMLNSDKMNEHYSLTS